jgi:hypothetical protein
MRKIQASKNHELIQRNLLTGKSVLARKIPMRVMPPRNSPMNRRIMLMKRIPLGLSKPIKTISRDQATASHQSIRGSRSLNGTAIQKRALNRILVKRGKKDACSRTRTVTDPRTPQTAKALNVAPKVTLQKIKTHRR